MSERCTINVWLNDLESNTRLFALALGAAEGVIELITDGSAGFAPSMRRQQRMGAASHSINVGMTTLDSVSRSGLTPDVIKIDVEGAELACIRGAKGVLEGSLCRSPRKLYVEVHPAFLPQFDASEQDVRSSLRDLGYEIDSENRRAAEVQQVWIKRG